MTSSKLPPWTVNRGFERGSDIGKRDSDCAKSCRKVRIGPEIVSAMHWTPMRWSSKRDLTPVEDLQENDVNGTSFVVSLSVNGQRYGKR